MGSHIDTTSDLLKSNGNIVLPRTLIGLFGRRLEALPQTVLSLTSVWESFFCYIHGTDAISQHHTNTLDRYLQYNKTNRLVLDVCVTSHPEGIELLGVVMVPQLRVISGGKELHRQIGTVDYETLDKVLGYL